MLRESFIAEALFAHIANCFDTDAADGWFPKRLLAFNSSMECSATFVTRITDAAMDEKKYSVTYASNEQMHRVQAYKDERRSLQRKYYFGHSKVPCKKSSKRRFECPHSAVGNEDIKQHSSTSKSSKEK